MDSIKGIGPRTAEALLKHFKSVKRIRQATLDEIAAVVGAAKARTITEGFAENDKNKEKNQD